MSLKTARWLPTRESKRVVRQKTSVSSNKAPLKATSGGARSTSRLNLKHSPLIGSVPEIILTVESGFTVLTALPAGIRISH